MTAKLIGDIENLSQRYRSALMKYFTRRRTSYSDAEDMTQEVFVRLISNHSNEVDNPDAYIFQIAANLIRDQGRKVMVRKNQLAVNTLAEVSDADFFDPARILVGREALVQVVQIISDLPERTRHIFILYRIEGMAQKDIAYNYGISMRAVQKHVAKAVEAIYLQLNKKGLDS